MVCDRCVKNNSCYIKDNIIARGLPVYDCSEFNNKGIEVKTICSDGLKSIDPVSLENLSIYKAFHKLIPKHHRYDKEKDKIVPDVLAKPNAEYIDSRSLHQNLGKLKYDRVIVDKKDPDKTALVDVYSVLKAFDVKCPALQHLIKKALCAGLRGHKDISTDLQDIIDSAIRAKELYRGENI